MKVKTSELSGKALDHAVHLSLGLGYCSDFKYGPMYFLPSTHPGVVAWEGSAPCYSTAWSQGGPIIDDERIGVCHYNEADGWEVPNWAAWRTDTDDRQQIMGESALIAAMRCYVQVKLGDEVDVPEGLL